MSQQSYSPRVAFIEASWHDDILIGGRESFVAEMVKAGVPAERIDIIKVPGAFEIPLEAQRLARAGQHQAIVASALIVDGGIYRHEFVAQAVIEGLMRVQLDEGVPVLSLALTPQQFHEHGDHHAFFKAHFVGKGREVAQACAQVLTLRAQEPPLAEAS